MHVPAGLTTYTTPTCRISQIRHISVALQNLAFHGWAKFGTLFKLMLGTQEARTCNYQGPPHHTDQSATPASVKNMPTYHHGICSPHHNQLEVEMIASVWLLCTTGTWIVRRFVKPAPNADFVNSHQFLTNQPNAQPAMLSNGSLIRAIKTYP